MSYEDFELSVSLIDKNSQMADFAGPQDATLVMKAERRLGLVFPRSYREFLLRYGCGDICGHEFYGLFTNNFDSSGVPDAVWRTLQERNDSCLPEGLVVIYSIGDGTLFCLNCDIMSEWQEAPVVVWSPGESGRRENLIVEAEDFGAFLLGRLGGLRRL